MTYVTPEGENVYKDIIVPKRLVHKAKPNDKVVVRVTEWPKEGRGLGAGIANRWQNPGDEAPRWLFMSIMRKFPASSCIHRALLS